MPYTKHKDQEKNARARKSPGLITARLASTAGVYSQCLGRRHHFCRLQTKNRNEANLVCKAGVTRLGCNEATPVFHARWKKCNEKVTHCGAHVGIYSEICNSRGQSQRHGDPVVISYLIETSCLCFVCSLEYTLPQALVPCGCRYDERHCYSWHCRDD